jgi:uncharacterized metal-binding protein
LNSTNTFLVGYAALVFFTTSILSLFRVNVIGIYLLLFAAEFYVATEITPPLELSASRRNTIFAVLFAGIFIAIVLQSALSVLQQTVIG